MGDTDFDNWTYYAQGALLSKGSTTASGTARISDIDIADGTYGLSMYSEQANGYDRTDYAGAMKNLFNVKVKDGAVDQLILVATAEPLTITSTDAVVHLADGATYTANLTAEDSGRYVVESGQTVNLQCRLELNGGILDNAGTTSVNEAMSKTLIQNSGTLSLGEIENYGAIQGAGTLNLCKVATTEAQPISFNDGTIEQNLITVGSIGSLQNYGSMTAADKITIETGGTVSNGGLLSAASINNAGTLTSSLETTHLSGTLTNTGTFNLKGNLVADVLGSGTTVLNSAVVKVASDRTIAGNLNTNSQTLNMQDGKYSTLTVDSLTAGDSTNLKLDADLTNDGSDHATASDVIKINGSAANSSGTLNLVSLNYSGNLTAGGSYSDYINYVSGNNAALTYQLLGDSSADAKIVAHTDQYSLTFSLGSAGYLDLLVGDYDSGVTLQQFIRGTKNPEGLTYIINADRTISEDLTAVGTTARAAGSDLHLYINKGATLTAATAGYGGITVGNGYTLNVNGSVANNKMSTMTNFANPLTNEDGGTVTVTDMAFTGNTAAAGTGVLTNAGTMTLDNVTVNNNGTAQAVVNTGTLILADHMSTLDSGVTDGGTGTSGTVEFRNIDADLNFKIQQKSVKINSTASLTAGADQLNLSGDIVNDGKFVFTAGSTDTPYTLNNKITNTDDSLGTTTVTAASNIVVNSDIKQKNIINEGSLTTNADHLKAANGSVTNNGTLTLTGGTMDERTAGSGTVVAAGAVTVTGNMNQSAIKVQSGQSLDNKANLTADITNEGQLVNSASSTVIAGDVKNSGSATIQNAGIVQTTTLDNSGAITGSGILKVYGEGTNSGTIEQGTVGIKKTGKLTNTGTVTATAANAGTLVNQGTANISDLDNSGTISGSGTLNLYSTGDNNGTIGQNIINVENEAVFTNLGTVTAPVINVVAGGTAKGLTIDQVLNVEGSILNTRINADGVMNYAPDATADAITLTGTMQLSDLTGSGDTYYGMGDLAGDGGTINLADNTAQSYSTPGRTLDLDTVSGTVTFGVNSDLANNVADNIVIADASDLTANIKVLYDPYYKTYDPEVASTVPYGIARVLTVSSGTITVKGVDTDWGSYRITPLIVDNGDGTYDLTNSRTKHASESTMTAADARSVLNQAWLADTDSLTQRLGDLRLGDSKDDGIWARYKRNTSHVSGDRLAELNANKFQAGYDKKFERKDGSSYVGLAVSRLDGSSSYDNGSGDVKATSVALYNTWIGNSGHYYDLVLQQGHYDNKYRWTDLAGVHSGADYSVNATTVSGEYGWRKQLGRGAYLEPQAQIIYGHVGGADYTTDLGWPVHVDSFEHFITRLGLAAGRQTKQGNYYARSSYYHDFGGGGDIAFDDYFYDRRAVKDWGELTIGGDIRLKNQWRLYGEVTKYLGDLRNNLNYELGARFTF